MLLSVNALAHGGAGVARPVETDAEDQRVWFVPGTLPGERVRATIRRQKKGWIEGELEAVEVASDRRVEPPCPLAGVCGGCAWLHVAPEHQAQLKAEIVVGQLRKLRVPAPQVFASPQALAYRRRARLHYERVDGEFRLGFLKARGKEVVDHASCPVLDAALNHAVARLREAASHLPASGEVHVLSDGTRAVIGLPGIVPNTGLEAALQATLDEVLVGYDLRAKRKRIAIGRATLEIDAAGEHPALSAGPFVFAQAQAKQNEALVEWVRTQADSRGKRVLELYAGSGNFTRALARDAKRVRAVDEDREALFALRDQLAELGLSVEARRGDATGVLDKAATGRGFEVVVLDPPRRGLGQPGTRQLARVAQERIVYISCDPATLARDLSDVIERGFRIAKLAVFDMMPMTPEVETVVTLEREPRR